jgi:hypothetical protein
MKKMVAQQTQQREKDIPADSVDLNNIPEKLSDKAADDLIKKWEDTMKGNKKDDTDN